MYFGDEKYDEAYLKLEKVKQALKDYKQELTNPTPDAVIFPADSLQGKIDRLKKELKDLESQGKSFGDALYDSTYKALTQTLLKDRRKHSEVNYWEWSSREYHLEMQIMTRLMCSYNRCSRQRMNTKNPF